MMRCKRFIFACALAACVCVLVAGGEASQALAAETRQEKKQEPGKDAKKQGPKLSADEAKAASKINEAKDAPGKLAAAVEFIKKYPKSQVRQQAAEHVAYQIGAVQDSAQRISLGEQYIAAFTGPGEADLVAGPMLDAYIAAERTADAFRAGAAYLKTHPDDVDLMRRLAIIATNAAIKGSNDWIAPGREYAAKAAEMIETDKKPAAMDAAAWAEYKTKWLPGIYREAGVLAIRAGDMAAARAAMAKAAALRHPDPYVYLVIGDAAHQEYNDAATKYRAMPEGAEKAARRAEIEKILDRVIETYAQSLAMMEGNPQFDAARQQIRQDLESYYKYRRGSTNGLQELIDKYKTKPAGQ